MRLIDGRGLALVRGGRLLFDRLDLQLAPGEGILITGPNGVGKSSLIRLVAGLLRPASGSIERAAAGLADEGLALDRELPLGRALGFWGGPFLGEAIAAFGLEALTDVPVRMLSAGQGKRARLARVMATGAPLWLIDEPLNALDRDGTDRLAAALAAHRAGGGGVLAASHAPLAGQWREVAL